MKIPDRPAWGAVGVQCRAWERSETRGLSVGETWEMGAAVGSGVEPVKGVRGESPCHVTPFLTSQMFGKFIITCTVLSVHGMELSLAPWVTQKWSRDHICGLRGQTMNT